MQPIIISLISLLISFSAILKIYLNLKKEQVKHSNIVLETMQKMIENLEKTNDNLVKKLDRLVILQEQGKAKIIIGNQSQMNILRGGLNVQQRENWILAMLEVFKENNIKNKKLTIEKIITRTNNIIYTTDAKFNQISGAHPYLIGYRSIIGFLEKEDVYNTIYNLLSENKNKEKTCVAFGTCFYKLEKNLRNLWEITQLNLFNNFKEYFKGVENDL